MDLLLINSGSRQLEKLSCTRKAMWRVLHEHLGEGQVDLTILNCGSKLATNLSVENTAKEGFVIIAPWSEYYKLEMKGKGVIISPENNDTYYQDIIKWKSYEKNPFKIIWKWLKKVKVK